MHANDCYVTLEKAGVYLGEQAEVAYDKAYDVLYPYYAVGMAEYFKFAV